MTQRLLQIDASNLGDHARLLPADRCLYAYEYTSGRDYLFSQTNSLINNLKKKPSSSSQAELRYKANAIQTCSTLFASTLNQAWLDEATLVPIPGSKAAGHADFDDRMSQILRGIRAQVDVRELVRQKARWRPRTKRAAVDGPRLRSSWPTMKLSKRSPIPRRARSASSMMS